MRPLSWEEFPTRRQKSKPSHYLSHALPTHPVIQASQNSGGHRAHNRLFAPQLRSCWRTHLPARRMFFPGHTRRRTSYLSRSASPARHTQKLHSRLISSASHQHESRTSRRRVASQAAWAWLFTCHTGPAFPPAHSIAALSSGTHGTLHPFPPRPAPRVRLLVVAPSACGDPEHAANSRSLLLHLDTFTSETQRRFRRSQAAVGNKRISSHHFSVSA
ncbi:hypothetical protein BD309DRAFT_962285 [Dichomitus squalens]|nr:hypothetical protein BD309DRAFT_962285 [Dichomitus squalens]